MVQEENVKGCGGEDGGKARGSAQWGGLAGGGGEEMKKRKHLHLDSNNFVVMGWCMGLLSGQPAAF